MQPFPEKEALLALAYEDGLPKPRGKKQCIPFFLKIYWDAKKCAADLPRSWVPLPGRLGQVYESWIEAMVGEERFSSSSLCSYRHARYVPDPNLLCRYLIGEATEDEVRAAADEYVEEISAREQLAAAQKRLAELEQQVRNLTAKVSQAQDATNSRIEPLHDLARNLANAAEWQWFKGRDLKQALREFRLGTLSPPPKK